MTDKYYITIDREKVFVSEEVYKTYRQMKRQERTQAEKDTRKSALGKAMTYLREQWPYLCNYLLDGRLEISNNRAERSIKPFVIDRKNFLFANTPGGAQGSAVMFSLIQTAIENNIDPYKYLVWVMKKGQKLKDTDKNWAEKLLPEKYMLDCGGAV